MNAVLQRVSHARVTVHSDVVGQIERGLLVYVGVHVDDGPDQADKLAHKIASLRIFEDEEGKMNLSVRDIGGGLLVVPNFTLQADARKGRRPAFILAARPEQAEPLFHAVVTALAALGCPVATGVFGAHMHIDSQADGPVNIILDIPPASDNDNEAGNDSDKANTNETDNEKGPHLAPRGSQTTD